MGKRTDSFCRSSAQVLSGREVVMITQLLINGLAMGAIYALVALGIVMIYNAAAVVNFAQGEFVMVGAFVSYTMLAVVKLPYFLAFLATMVS